MRFSAADRRSLSRRLKNRLPAAFACVRRQLPQLMLVVSTCIVLTPTAKAKVEANEATIALTKTDPNIVTKTYTKEELNRKMPANPVIYIGDRISDEVTAVFKGMTANQGGDVQKAKQEELKTKQAGKDAWDMSIARMKDGTPLTAKPDKEKLRGYLSLETKKAFSIRAGQVFPTIAKMKGGLDLTGFTSLFKREAKPVAGTQRYGLILVDITPDKVADDRASLGDDEDEMRYAGHADVHWTIGPIDEAQGRQLFAFGENGSGTAEEPSLWSQVHAPKLNFKTKLKPEATVTSLTDLPIWRLEVTEQDGLLGLIYRTTAQGKRVSQEESVTLPVAGNMTIGRRFNDKWEAIQTSACNILFDKRMPLVSVHYMHLEERFRGEVSHQIDAGTKLTMAARGKATGKVLEHGEGDRPEAYTLEYNKTF